MSERNIAFYFQDFTNTLADGIISYTTASVVPSNSVGNRVLVITTRGTFQSKQSSIYTMVLDFTNVKSERQISLEGPLQGQLNICGKTLNAQDFVSYELKDRILILTITLRTNLKKERRFYLNFQINDSSCVKGNGYPLVYYYDPQVGTSVKGFTTNYGADGCSTATNFGALGCSFDCSLCKTTFGANSFFGSSVDFCITNGASCTNCDKYSNAGNYVITSENPPPKTPFYYFGTKLTISKYVTPS